MASAYVLVHGTLYSKSGRGKFSARYILFHCRVARRHFEIGKQLHYQKSFFHSHPRVDSLRRPSSPPPEWTVQSRKEGIPPFFEYLTNYWIGLCVWVFRGMDTAIAVPLSLTRFLPGERACVFPLHDCHDRAWCRWSSICGPQLCLWPIPCPVLLSCENRQFLLDPKNYLLPFLSKIACQQQRENSKNIQSESPIPFCLFLPSPVFRCDEEVYGR